MSWLSKALGSKAGKIALAPFTGGLSLLSSGGGASSAGTGPSNYEQELKKLQYEDILQSRKDAALLRPLQLEALGYRELPDGTLEKIPVQRDPLEQAYYDNALKAARGELSVSPALEADIGKRRAALREELSRRGGSNVMLGSAAQRLNEFDMSADITREEARRGLMTTGEGLLSSRMGLLSDVNQRRYDNTQGWNLPRYQTNAGLYSSAYAPYQFDRNMALQQQGIRSQDKAGRMGLLGTLAGTAGTLALLSSKDAKTDIKKASGRDEDKMLNMMKDTDVHAWNYKGDSKRRIGMLTENAPNPMVMGDGKHLDVPTYMGLLHASVKSLANKVDKLERRG